MAAVPLASPSTSLLGHPRIDENDPASEHGSEEWSAGQLDMVPPLAGHGPRAEESGQGQQNELREALEHEACVSCNWRWAIHLLGEFLRDSPPWESEEFFRMRENLLDLVVMSCGAAGRWRMALSIFSNMRFVQVVPGQLAYQHVVIACREAGAFTIADQLCEEMRICTGHVEHGLSISPGLEKSYLRKCEEVGDWQRALQVLGEMQWCAKEMDEIACGTAAAACANGAAWEAALALQSIEGSPRCIAMASRLFRARLRLLEAKAQRGRGIARNAQIHAVQALSRRNCWDEALHVVEGLVGHAAARVPREPLVMLGLSLANESRQWERALHLQDLTNRHHGGGGWVSGPLAELLVAVGRWKHALQVTANLDLRVRAAAAGRLWQAAYHLVGGIVESMQQHRVSGSSRPIPVSSLTSVLRLRDSSAVGLSQQAMNMAVDAAAQKHRWQQAIQLLEAARLLQRSDIITLNTCLTAALRAESWQQALALLADGRSARLPLSSVTLGAGLDAAQRGSAWQLALGMLSQEGGLANAVAINAAAGAAATAACWEIALGLLQDHHFHHNRPDVVACTVAVASCSAASRWEQALSLLSWYGARGVQPDVVMLQQIQCSCDVGMVPLDPGPIPIQYKTNLRRVSSRLLSDGYDWAQRRQKGASLAVVAAQALEQWAALSSEDARCVARVLRRPVLAVLQRLRGDPGAQTSARHLPLRDVFLESQSTLGSPMTAETMLDLHLVFTSPSMLRCLAPSLLTASQTLRAMLHTVKEGAWSERELWRAAVALFAALCDNGIEPTVEQVNLAIEICKEARAIRPMFEMYKSARRLPSFRPDYGTFENLASGGTLAPGQYWWHCLLFMEEAQDLLPRKQLTSSMTKTIKACSDASAWGTALFHLRPAMDLATSTVPGRHAQLPELLRERLEDLRLGNAPERSEGGYKARGWADQWDFQRQVPVRRVGKLRMAVPGVPVPAFQDKVAEFFRACAQDKIGKLPGLSEMLETSYRNLWQRGSRLKVESQELLGLERLSSVRSALREETLQAFRRHRYRSLLGLQLLRGLRRRRALEASLLLRSDVLLEKQSGLGLGTPEALQLVKLSSDASITIRPHRRTRLRQRYKRGTSRISRSRRCPSTAWKGRLQVRRAEKEEGGGDCAEIIQAKAAWVSYRLLVDRSRYPESEVPRKRRAEEIQPLLPGQIMTEEVVSAGRHMGEGGGGSSMYLPSMKILLDRAEHAERVALASVLNRLGDAKKIRGVVRLYTSAALCISCLAAFCHCKRLLTSLFFEISCDSADESQRWSDTAAGGEESLDKFRTSGFASAFVSKMHVISHIALAGRNPGRQVDRGRFGVCLWWRVHWRCPRFRLASLEDPAEQRDGRSLAAALGLACHEVYDISQPACPSRVAAELQPDEQGVSRSPWLSLSLPTVTSASLTTTEADLSKLPKIGQGMDKSEFLDLLKKLIGESKHLQNNPRLGIHPEEKRAAAVVIKELEAVSTRAGGPLILEELEYVPGRSNLKVTYPGSGKETTAFVGSHFDVVPADPEAWSKDPFQLTVEGDLLYGRGTTDCLGHVALLTLFLRELGRTKPALKRSIVVVFIAAEEGGEKNIGVDAVLKNGKLEEAKNGPVYWVDSADSNPCCGTSGALSWSLKCRGRLFHSGFPNKAINSIELANEAIAFIQERFYNDFKPLPEEELYSFGMGSHMKPTQIECSKGSFNQIPAETTVHGDIRLGVI
ncbi:unnamed protein product [Symbiodinium necroappetens]|uniref:Peptidase M20 dimerisation domain-containing protein n=1 Tax=Symbiodinium necroappetens TaxID=1628268 RepID=A0A813ADA8_9DINO|nr:unnamed protein product [Symbiodinium necroappetens]